MKTRTCEKCTNKINGGEKLCRACIEKMYRELSEVDREIREDTGTDQVGCISRLTKRVDGAIKQLTSKATHLHSSNKEYADKAIRKRTFIGTWPSRLNHERIERFARWGFFYTGRGDCVRCYQCGIILREWTEDDDPLKEHIRFSSDCHHLRSALLNRQSFHINKILDAVKLCFDNQPQAEMPLERTVHQILAANDLKAIMEENKVLREQMTCIVCFYDWKRILFLPCKHLWVCHSCGTGLEICPCGVPVEKRIKVKFHPDF